MGPTVRNTSKNLTSVNNFITNDLIMEEGQHYLEENATIEKWAIT
jgi:hypothetical protein